MMRSNSFDTQEVRDIGQKGSRRVKRLFILWMGITEHVVQVERKECIPGKIEDVKKKIHARTGKVL